MFKRPQSTVPFAIECALLFLALAVFSWGLQAKLSLYKTHGPSSTGMVAKLSMEKHSSHTIASRERDGGNRPAEKVDLPASVSLHGILVFSLALHQVALGLSNPSRYDLHGLYSLHRPPPSFS